MRSSFLPAAFAAAVLVPSITAQQVYNQADADRRASTVFVFSEQGAEVATSISYSQPTWKPEYDKMLDTLKGEKRRLGKNWWTTLSTMQPIEISGTRLDAGVWFLGIECDKAGEFHLLAMESGMAIKNKLMPWGGDDWKHEVKIPLKMTMDASEKVVSKMDISIAADTETGENGEFAIRWGKHALTADVSFKPAKVANAAADKMQKKAMGELNDAKKEAMKKMEKMDKK